MEGVSGREVGGGHDGWLYHVRIPQNLDFCIYYYTKKGCSSIYVCQALNWINNE